MQIFIFFNKTHRVYHVLELLDADVAVAVDVIEPGHPVHPLPDGAPLHDGESCQKVLDNGMVTMGNV